MEDMMFEINNPVHSKQIQDALFELGYRWILTGEIYRRTEASYLFTDKEGTIMFSQMEPMRDIVEGYTLRNLPYLMNEAYLEYEE